MFRRIRRFLARLLPKRSTAPVLDERLRSRLKAQIDDEIARTGGHRIGY